MTGSWRHRSGPVHWLHVLRGAEEWEGLWTTSVPERKRSPLSRLVPLAVILLLLAVGAIAYYETSGFLDANGTWYGPMRIASGGVTVSVETYMEVSTSLTGHLSGKGTFCIPLPFGHTATFDYSLSGQHAFTFLNYGTQPPIVLTVEYTVPVILGVRLLIGPQLQLHGDATSTSFHPSNHLAPLAVSSRNMRGAYPVGFVRQTLVSGMVSEGSD
jgi:hypothetical protein